MQKRKMKYKDNLIETNTTTKREKQKRVKSLIHLGHQSRQQWLKLLAVLKPQPKSVEA